MFLLHAADSEHNVKSPANYNYKLDIMKVRIVTKPVRQKTEA